MLFSQTVEYALRAIVWLADHPDEPQTNPQISEATQVPPGYLFKVLQALGRAGLVQGQRGAGGGFTLAKSAEDITVLEVINVIDPVRRIETCPLGIKSHGKHLCPLHKKLDQAAEWIESAFHETTIADLLKTGSRSRPLCAENRKTHKVTVKGKG